MVAAPARTACRGTSATHTHLNEARTHRRWQCALLCIIRGRRRRPRRRRRHIAQQVQRRADSAPHLSRTGWGRKHPSACARQKSRQLWVVDDVVRQKNKKFFTQRSARRTGTAHAVRIVVALDKANETTTQPHTNRTSHGHMTTPRRARTTTEEHDAIGGSSVANTRDDPTTHTAHGNANRTAQPQPTLRLAESIFHRNPASTQTNGPQ